MRDAGPEAAEAARALGMSPAQVLRHVRLPLAAPAIMAGIRTAAVIDVGTATLAAFIGAGGLGDPIVAGLALTDTRMILSGAIPAALLALLVDAALGPCERWVTARRHPVTHPDHPPARIARSPPPQHDAPPMPTGQPLPYGGGASLGERRGRDARARAPPGDAARRQPRGTTPATRLHGLRDEVDDAELQDAPEASLIGEDYMIEDEGGSAVYKVDGKVMRSARPS